MIRCSFTAQRRSALFVAILFSVALLQTGFAPTGYASDSRQPNIIFIMADDLGYGDLGCYGQELVKTPCLDAMAQQGMRFTDFYSGCTVCAPARSVLMTG